MKLRKFCPSYLSQYGHKWHCTLTRNLWLFCIASYDLMKACKDIGEGTLHVPELLGNLKIEPITKEGAYDVKLDSRRVRNDRVLELLQRYTNRKSFAQSHKRTNGDA